MSRSITREVLYCRTTGRRLPPERGRTAQPGPIAVAVFDDGTSRPIFGDTLLGRDPAADRHVRNGNADAWAIADPGRQISRSHVLLRRSGRHLEAVDLGSRNGTSMVGSDRGWHDTMPGLGERITDGQQLRLGHRVLTIHYLQR